MKLPGKRDRTRPSGRVEEQPPAAEAVAPESVAPVSPAPEAKPVGLLGPLLGVVLIGSVFAVAFSSTSKPPVAEEKPTAATPPIIKEEAPKEPEVRLPLRGAGLKREAFDCYEAAAAALPVLEPRFEAELNAWAKNPAEPLPKALLPLVEKASVALGELAKGADAQSATPKSVSEKLGHGSVLLARLALARARLELEGGANQQAVERALEVVRLGQDLARTESTALLGSALTNEAAKALEAWLAKSPNLPREPIARVLKGSPRTNATYARALARIEALTLLKKGKAS